MRRSLLQILAAATLAVALYPVARAAAQSAPVELRILAINDFHGNLRPPPGGIRIADPNDKTKKVAVAAGGAEHMATLVKQLRQPAKNTILRRRRRPDRRQPVAVGDVSRRADHRIAVDDGDGAGVGRQSRIRRGQGRIAAHAEWRLSSNRQMPGAAPVPRRKISLSRSQHHRQGHRQDHPSGLRDQDLRRHPRGFHRPDLAGHAQTRLSRGRRRARIQGRSRDGECAGAGIEGARRRGDRRADPRRRLSRPATTTNARAYPDPSSTSSGNSTVRSTSSSAATPIRPMSARSTTGWSPSETSSAPSSPRST